MINPFAFLRAVAWLKRIAMSLERCAESLETICNIYGHLNIPKPMPRKTEFDTLDQEVVNKRWAEFIKERGVEP